MTDTQVKYQTLMENQRHNLEMEKIGARETKVKERTFEYNKWMGLYDRISNILPTLFGMADTMTHSASNASTALKNGMQAFGSLFH